MSTNGTVNIMVDVNTREKLSKLSMSNEGNVFDLIRKTDATKSATKVKEYFQRFDKNQDGFLDLEEFTDLLFQIFCNKGQHYPISEKKITDFLKLLDENQDGKIDLEEFTVCWHHWLKQILDPVSAFIVVDVQNDFISGTMAINNCPAGQDGLSVIPVINNILDTVSFDVVVYSADWHPANHISFIENIKTRKMHHSSKVAAENAKHLDTVVFEGPPMVEQKMWPGHCVHGSWGSEFHKELKVVENAVLINKGTNPNIDSYSAFWDNNKMSQTPLVQELTSRGITDVYVCGLAYDVCVGATACHAIEHGFRTILIDDASRGVCLPDIKALQDKLLRLGGVIVQSDEVAALVNAQDRRPDLGYQAALNVTLARKLIREERKQNASKDPKSLAK